ncbi:response regulator [bacterium]|nr:response regulator [bacterium]
MNPAFTNSDILTILKEARLFSQFSDDQLEQLISFSSVESFAANQTIIEQGQKNDKIFILLKGLVSVYTDDEFILSLRRQGDLVGEMSVITKQPTTARVIAQEPSLLFSISSENINQSKLADLKSTVYKLFLDILTEKLTMTTKQVIGFQATSEELSVKKQELAKSEDVIVQKEAILQQVLGSMSDGVVVMEKEGCLLHVNRAFRDMVGNGQIPDDYNCWPEEIGFYQSDEKTPYTIAELPMTTIFRGKPVDSEEIFIRNKNLPDGMWLQASSRMLESTNNIAARSAVVVFRDFTKKKLEEKALIKAKENAEATAKAKSDFLAAMSHELRTPLHGIMGMTELVYGTDLNEEQKGYLGSIKSSSEHLLNLIRNILDYSNLESEKLPLKNEPFSVRACIEEMVATYTPHAAKKGIQLKSSVSPRLPQFVIGNRHGITQILRNLIDNAIKFSNEGEVHISAEMTSQIESNAKIVLTVTDTGIGIDVVDLADLFQPFSQLDSSSSRSFDGSGIGLSICKKYAEKMNGEIRVNSKIGEGSIFEVVLNLTVVAPENVTPQPADETEQPVPWDTSFSLKYPLTILVAEDNALNQKLIHKVLEKLGYTPELVSNGLEAVEASRKKTFDLIFMDLHMPKMDGIEASRIINGEMKTPGKPKIIALTANVSEEVKQTCLAAGMTDYTTKPLKIDHLYTLLQKIQ